MSDVSPELQQLVQESRSASLPSQADAARVLAALRAKLGESALLGVGGALTSGSARLVLPKMTTIALAGIALYGGALILASPNQRIARHASSGSPSVHAAETTRPGQATTSASTNDSRHVAPIPTSVSPAPVRTDPHSLASHPSRDTLAEEVAILSRAEMELHRGKPENALTLLREHERRFANGLLKEERIAARVQALCALGRATDADAQETLLSPNSLHAHPSRRACGASSRH